MPGRSVEQSGSSSIVRTSVAHTADGQLVVGVVSFGLFAIPSHTAMSSSSHTTAYSIWGFAEAARGQPLTAIGELGHHVGGSGSVGGVMPGAGPPVFRRGDQTFRVCDAGRGRMLPAQAAAADRIFLAGRVDGDHFYTLHADLTRSRRCTGLAAGTIAINALVVQRISLTDTGARWESIRRDAVAAPSGKGCRSRIALAADVDRQGALVVTSTCSHQDAGDSIATNDCTLAANVLTAGARASSLALPARHEWTPSAAVSLHEGTARVAVGEAGTQVFVVAKGRATAQGAVIPGEVTALHGTRVVITTPDGKPGLSGSGFRHVVHEFRGGTWAAVTEPVESTAREWAFAFEGDEVVAVLAQDESTNVTVHRTLDGKWQSLGTLDAYPTPRAGG